MEVADEPGTRRALVAAVRGFHARGWCPATSSNFSYRAPAGARCFISQSGVDKADFGPEHLMAVDADGRPVPPEPRRASAETLLHTLVYRLRPEVGAVLHVHAPLSVSMSLAFVERGAIRFTGFELQKGFEGVTTHETELSVPIFPNDQNMARLSSRIEPTLRDAPGTWAFLLAGHGLYAFGRTVADAKRHVEVVEALLEQQHLLRQLGSAP